MRVLLNSGETFGIFRDKTSIFQRGMGTLKWITEAQCQKQKVCQENGRFGQLSRLFTSAIIQHFWRHQNSCFSQFVRRSYWSRKCAWHPVSGVVKYAWHIFLDQNRSRKCVWHPVSGVVKYAWHIFSDRDRPRKCAWHSVSGVVKYAWHIFWIKSEPENVHDIQFQEW